MIFFDTESIGFFGPTVLIQYAIDDGEVVLHNVFEQTAGATCELIETFIENEVCGFNLAHDWFHLTRTYNCLKCLPQNKVPLSTDVYDVERTEEAHRYCLKPSGSLDLMIHGRQNELQATMNQKPIRIRKVPKLLAEYLVEELEKRVHINDLYFAKKDGKKNWRIIPIDTDGKEILNPTDEDEINEDLVNIRLDFFPSTGLKPIVKFLLKKEIDLIENMIPLPKVKEYSWYPCSGDWFEVGDAHIFGWSNDKRRIKYAIDDVHHTRDLYHYFNRPTCSEDSDLACMVGGLHWQGYAVDLALANKLYQRNKKYLSLFQVNYNSPKQVKEHLLSLANNFEKILIKSTNEETLNALAKNPSKLGKASKHILSARSVSKQNEFLEKLLIAGKLYVTFKVTGTKSNRMSGGSMVKKGGSINPQGIAKGSRLREVCTLAGEGMVLSNGDFDGFEVAIAEAVYNDPKLREDLLSGKKIHGLWGSTLYKMSYDEIMQNKALYNKAKSSFFGKLYGAFTTKLAEVTGLSEEEVIEAERYFESHYEGVGQVRQRLMQRFQAMHQPNGIGSAIHWKEPAEYAESFLGFRRYFTLEWATVRALFTLAQNPTDAMKDIKVKVVRRDRQQTASGACQSALYGSAFSLQASIIRAALNHEIQSPGGQLTKRLQSRVWEIQPKGIHSWKVMPMNIHDELECPVVEEEVGHLKQIVEKFILDHKSLVPLISMEWKERCHSWGDK